MYIEAISPRVLKRKNRFDSTMPLATLNKEIKGTTPHYSMKYTHKSKLSLLAPTKAETKEISS